MPTTGNPGSRRGFGGRQDHHHARSRADPGRGPGYPRLHRRLPPLRPQAARGPGHHPAASGLQLHRHRRSGPGAPAGGPRDPQARLPPRRRDLRGPRVREAARLHRGRGTARLPHARYARVLRRARLPGAARGSATQVEGAARLLSARLHDRRGARRARPPRAGLGGVHPPPGTLRRHGDLVPTGRGRRSRLPRRRGGAARRAAPPRPVALHRQRRGRLQHEGARAGAAPVHPGRHRPGAGRRRSRRRSGIGCISRLTCAASGWASSRSASTCTARSRSRWSSF